MSKRKKRKLKATSRLKNGTIVADLSVKTGKKVAKPSKPMKIILHQDVFAKLEAARVQVGGLEFSGLGFVNVKKTDKDTTFEVYDIVVLDVGSGSYTEIPSEKLLPLLDRSDAGKMKCWFHRHPLGNATPGTHNWSATDDRTAEREPLGGIPELVKWSISIVRTPQTWVGRCDQYRDGKVITYHIPVEYGVDPSFIEGVASIQAEYLKKEAQTPLSGRAPINHGYLMLNFMVRLKSTIDQIVTSMSKKIGRKNG